MNTVRIALPGYNAKTDTNLDHFSLYTDQDNILIKEYLRGSTIVTNAEVTRTIPHNFDYIPFFLVYALDPGTNKYQLVPNFQSAISVPDYAAYADNTNLYISNFSSDTTFKYYIFYDNMNTASGITITESEKVFKIPKTGYDTTEKDPNNLIFHSDLNTFKILKEGNANITYTADGNYTIAHGLLNYTSTSSLLFIKFPDGFTALIPGHGTCYSKDRNWSAGQVSIDSTNITVYIQRPAGTDTALVAKYYIFETPLV